MYYCKQIQLAQTLMEFQMEVPHREHQALFIQ